MPDGSTWREIEISGVWNPQPTSGTVLTCGVEIGGSASHNELYDAFSLTSQKLRQSPEGYRHLRGCEAHSLHLRATSRVRRRVNATPWSVTFSFSLMRVDMRILK